MTGTSAQTSHRFFAAVSPGLEPFLVEELAELGVAAEPLRGGVEARGNTEQLWSVCFRSRLAESVRVRLRPFVAKDFDALRAGLARLPWHAYLPQGAQVDVDVTCHHSRLWHSDAVAERLLSVVAERRGARPASKEASEAEATRIFVRIERDEAQVSIDASGERLHRRGYRTHVAEASLRETLAAALVHVARRNGANSPCLWDPFCGAGTIALEWLESELGRPAGARRSFAFERWPTHDAVAYAELVRRAPSGTQRPELRAFGSDIAERAIAAARSNAESADLAQQVELIHGDFEMAVRRIPEGACVITNPPYGVRLEEKDALPRLARVLSERRDLRPVVLLLGGSARSFQSHLPFATAAKTKNGGLSVRIELLLRR